MSRAIQKPRSIANGAASRNTLEEIPPLQNGDRLTRMEFERRYEAMPHLKKAELIQGVVYMPAAAIRFDQHGGPHFDLITWLGWYRAVTPGVRGGDNSSLRLDMENEPQPDAFLIVLPTHGGRACLDDDGYIIRGPELAAEVAASSASYDLHDKLETYQAHGVQEYLVWRVFDRELDWFQLRDRNYVRLLPRSGVYRSNVFPGLWLDAQALILGDMQRVSEVSQQGLASASHKAFVNQLQRQARSAEPKKRGKKGPDSGP